MTGPAFDDGELAGRVARSCAVLKAQGLDGLLISVPESIYWLTGLDHWGFFAAHVLVLNADGEMALVCRAMEGITVANQVRTARFYGHADN
ncbi:MAG: aminopeptidase P family N-terminal domain-containing protein, partial [Roseovarius confluentis]